MRKGYPEAVEAERFRDGPPPIIIERREIVGVVHPGDGPETMVHAALHTAAQYVSEQAEAYANAEKSDSRPFVCNVGFQYGSDSFAITVNDER